MSTTRIITIVCWIVSALVLTGLAIWFITGSIFGSFSHRLGDFNLFGVNVSGWENLTGPFEVDGVYNVGETGLDSIKVNWVAGEVTVRQHNGNDIQITELSQRELRDNEKLRYTISGGTLEISFRDRGITRGRMPQKRLEVLVPSNLSQSMKDLTIDSVSGSINITDIKASNLTTESVSGNLNASGAFRDIRANSVSGGITINNLENNTIINAETVSGRIDISGAFDRVISHSVSGATTILSTQLPSSFKADSVSGSFNITVPGNTPISINHSSVSGRLSSDVPVTMDGRGAAFEISTVSGSTNIYALG